MGEEVGTEIESGSYTIDKRIAQLLPEEVVRRTNMLPIKMEGDQLYVATTAPINLPGLDEIKLLTGLRVKPIIFSKEDLADAINEQFNAQQMSRQAIVDMTLQELETSKPTSDVQEALDVNEAPVVALVNSIIRGAVNNRASDIHLEPQNPEMIVRYRINGLLHDITTVPKYIEPSIISRIKLLADMDITEHRRPQDGHITMTAGQRQVDLRVSSVLTINGEKIVIRVLDKETMLIDLKHLGLTEDQQKMFRSFIAHPHGMILVTGPTGSGKSTTLYAALKEMDALTKNIITVENPVEYQMPRISQIQVNPNIGFTFASALRTIVRQDPDVIMVGEIRDTETAEIAIQAALTGHLVLSTLHTNDAPGAVIRLGDMGVQPFLIASSVIGVIAQRLVRSICPECKEFYEPSEEELEILGYPQTNVMLARGRGCDLCRGTGFRGRVGVYEIFEVDEDIRRLIIARAPSSEIKKLASEKGMRTLRDMAIEKILQGVSTIDEVRRVINLEEEKRLSVSLYTSNQSTIDGDYDQERSINSYREQYGEVLDHQAGYREFVLELKNEIANLTRELVSSVKNTIGYNQVLTPERSKSNSKTDYPKDIDALKEMFLTYFPKANEFLDGLIRTKGRNLRHHISKILSLLEEYPRSTIESAIERANLYGAYEFNAVRNICKQLTTIPKQIFDIEEQKLPFVSEPVEERSLSYYSMFEQ